MARQFTVSFKINGAMDGSLQAALNAAANAMRRLGQSASSVNAAANASKAGLAGMAAGLNQLQAATQKFRELKKALSETRTGLSEAQFTANSMAAKYRQDAAAVEKLRQELSRLVAARKQAEGTLTNNRSELDHLRKQRQELSRRAKDLGAKGFDKIPRDLLGTRQGVQLGEVLLQLKANLSALDSARQKFRANRDELNLLGQKIRETERALKSQENVARQSGNGFEEAKAKAAALKATLQQQQETLQRLRTALGSQGFSTTNFAASERQLAAEINRVNAALQRQQQLAAASARSQAAFGNLTMSAAGFMGSVYSAQQAMSPFTTATEKAVEFERVMSEVKALTQMDNIKLGQYDVVEKEMMQLRAQAKELGATTIYTAQQVGEAQAYIARTGWNTNKILASTPHFLKLAASGHMDMARAADIATNIMTGFGISADQAEHVADVLAYTTTHSNQNLEEMGEAMKYAAPVARMFGASLEETAAMTKFMADAGIKGSMAGTSMRQTMLRLVTPPKKASKAMQNMGLTVDDANAAWQNANAIAKEYGVSLDESLTPGRQMLSIVKQIDEKMAGKSSHEKMAAFSAITGINAVSGALNLFEAGSKALDDFTTALENCDGALEQTYGVMTGNTYGALKSMESAWEAVQLSIGTAISPLVRGAAEALTPLLTSLSQFIDRNQGVVVAIAGTVAALSGLMIAAAGVKLAFAGFTFITSSFGLATSAITAFRMGLAGIAVEATGIQAVFAVMGLRLASLRTAMAGLFAAGGLATTGGWATMFTAISTKAAAAATAIRGFFASLTLGSAASGAMATLSSIGTAIAGVARAAMAFAFSPIGVALMALALAGLYVYQNWDKVSAVFSNIASIVGGALAGAIRTVVTSFAAMSSNGTFDALCSSASKLASIVGGVLVKAFAVFLTVAASAIAVVLQLIGDVVKTIAELGGGIMNALGKATQGDFSGAVEALGNTATRTLNNIKTLGSHVFDGVEQGAKNVQQTLDALNMPKMPTQEVRARHAVQFDESGVAHSAPAAQPAQTPIDTSATQAALDQVGASAQNAATNMDGVNQAADAMGKFPSAVQPAVDGMAQAGTSAQTFGTNTQTAATSAQTFGTNAQAAGTNVQALGASSQGATGGITALGAAAQGACAGTSALGNAAGGAANAVSGLGAAAQAACSQLAAAGANAAAQVSAAAASAGGKPVAANYQGGIYKKGAFLTTFAEKSPEAAIPLDGSKRATELWRRAGEMLGILPKTTSPTFEPTITSPPFNPNIKLPDGKQIYSGSRQLPSRDETRRRQLPEIFTASPKLPERIQRSSQPKLPKINFPTASNSTSIIEKIFSSTTVESIFEKFTSTNAGGLIELITEKIFGTPTAPQPARTQIQIQMPPTNFPVATPPFAPVGNNSATFGNIFSTSVDQTRQRSPYQSTVNFPTTRPTFSPKFTTPPFAPVENNSAMTLETIRELQTVRTVPTENKSVSVFGNIFKTAGGMLFDKLASTKAGGLIGELASKIFGGTVDQTKRWGAYRTTPMPNASLFEPLENTGGIFEQLHEQILNPQPTASYEAAPINFTINVTVNGNADEQTVKRGVEQALPTVRNFADELRYYEHERRRVGYD